MSKIINLRIDKDKKDKANKICHELGITLSASIKIFINKMIKEHKIPFELDAYEPSENLLNSLKNADQIVKDPKRKKYKNAKELFKDLGV